MRYRKKPIMIEAVQFDGSNHHECFLFIGSGYQMSAPDDPSFGIQTLEGLMTANKGDWIIKGIKGEFYPCKPDIFAASYEPAPHLVMVCGADCHPGDSVCNNYCNEAPQKGPMAAAPPPGPDAQRKDSR